MDEKVRLLVCLGAAAAANCIPCFEHYYGKAQDLSIPSEDIQEAAEIAYRIKSNVNMLMKNSIRGLQGSQENSIRPDDKCGCGCG